MSESKSEFNLIKEPWIRVMNKDYSVEEVSLHDAILKAHEFLGLAGETKAQDFAILRFILAIMYTVFYRYDLNGEDIDLSENPALAMDNWKAIWEKRQIPSEPVKKYFNEWCERFWLFDDKYPFYQSKAVEGKTEKPVSTAKIIGTLFESNNKKRLFPERMEDGRVLSYSEAARWLLHLNCFDDIAAKQPVPAHPWVGHLGLIALKGNTLFETIMLNFCASVDVDEEVYEEKPSWEQDNNTIEFNRAITIVPADQAALLSFMSRRIFLCHNEDKVTGYYLSGGDFLGTKTINDKGKEVKNYYDEVFNEQMTLWAAYQEKENKNAPYKFKPALHTPEEKLWRKFGSIAGINKQDGGAFRRPGIIKWASELFKSKILPASYMLQLETAAVIYDFKQSSSLPVADVISDSLSFHAQLLEEKGAAWCSRIIMEIAKCDDAANQVKILYKNLQFSNGREDKDAKTNQSGELDAQMRFYNSIDRPFRLWLEDLKAESDMEDYSTSLEKELIYIARRLGESLVAQTGSQSIFGRAENSSAKAFNMYMGAICKIFNLAKAGENNE